MIDCIVVSPALDSKTLVFCIKMFGSFFVSFFTWWFFKYYLVCCSCWIFESRLRLLERIFYAINLYGSRTYLYEANCCSGHELSLEKSSE